MFDQVIVVSPHDTLTLSTSYVREADGAVDIRSCNVACSTRAVDGMVERSKRTNERRFAPNADATFIVVVVPELVNGLACWVNESATAVNVAVVILTGIDAAAIGLLLTVSDEAHAAALEPVTRAATTTTSLASGRVWRRRG
jgi:hypothetical protein